MTFLSAQWPSLFEIIGGTLEVIGAFLLANRYFAIRWWQIIPALLSAIINGNYAKNLAQIARMTPERELYGLKGILLLMVGFFVRTLPAIVHVIHGLCGQSGPS
jgi:hypothetical protein